MVVHHTKLLENTDKLLLLEEGRIRAFGPRDEVLARLGGNEQEERAQSKSPMPEPTLVQDPAPKPL
jgi:ABC-type protease/lipase transport system fused ATPase/permease subunit